jgi:hypothetical protein
MDFIVVLPKTRNKSVIMVVVDHLSKYDHFCSLQHVFITSTVAQIFMDNISSSMELIILLFFILIQLLPVISGKNYSGSKEPNFSLVQPIIPRRMIKGNGQQVYTNIFEVFCIRLTTSVGSVVTPR